MATKENKKTKLIKKYAVGLSKEQNGVQPGLYAGILNGVHIFLKEGIEDKDRKLSVELLDEESIAEKKLEAIQSILFNFDLEVLDVEVEVEVEEVPASN